MERIAELGPRLTLTMELDEVVTAETRLLAGHGAASRNPYGRNSFGVLEFECQNGETGVRFKLFGETVSGVSQVYSGALL